MRVWLQFQGVASSIPARSHTFVEIDHEIISTVILLPSADSFKKGCCQLQAKACARITGYPLVQVCPGKSVVRWTDRPAMTIAVDLGRKAPIQTNKQNKLPKFLQLLWDNQNNCIFNPYMPSVLYVGHRQIAQTQIRCHRMRRLIRVSTVCLHNFLLKLE